MLRSSDFHSDFASYSLTTHEIGVTGLSLEFSCEPKALSALLKEPGEDLFSWTSLQKSKISCMLTRENDHTFKVFLKANLLLGYTCVRCLEPLTHELALDFSITMIEREELFDDVPPNCFESDICDNNLEEEEMAVGYFAKRTIDLGLIMRDQIFLEVPDYPHCQATCKAHDALLNTPVSTRENPFVKFWKTN